MRLKSIKEEAAACRKAWRGKPPGTLAHCLHHEQHYELLTETTEARIAYILSDKPEGERALRLHLFRPVPAGKGPEWAAYAKAGAAYAKAGAALDKAGAAYDKARAARDKAWAALAKAWAARDKAGAAYDKARAARDKAGAALDKAGAAYAKAGAARDKARAAYAKARTVLPLDATHARDFPDCTWNGRSIFP